MKKKRRGLVLALAAAFIVLAGITAAVWGAANTPGSEGDPVVSKSYVDSKTSYAPLQLTAGQTLLGGEGTEIVVRSGEATVVTVGQNGISDLTAGADLMNGTAIGLNHMLLIPRNDGRGLTAVTEVWVMIRGTYTIQ